VSAAKPAPDAAEQQPDTKPGPYFVSMSDNGRLVRLLAGPYDRHTDALANVERVRELTVEADPFAHFSAFGTVRMRRGNHKTIWQTYLDAQLKRWQPRDTTVKAGV
jgi:hypothetical protein